MVTMSDDDRLAIVTVTYNSGRYLDDFLASTRQASASDVPVVVVDNGSSDERSLRDVAARYGARFVPMGRNAGYGAAVNRAVAELAVRPDWVLVSNPDVVLSAGSLDRLRATAEEDSDTGSVGPAVIETDGSIYPSARRIPSLRTGLGHALFANLWPDNPWTKLYHADDRPQVRRSVGWLSGACLLVRGDVFTRLGGFDERYFMYFEDVDLGWRIGRAGLANVYDPAISVVHVGAHATNDSSREMRRAHHRSAYLFLSTRYHGWHLLPLRLVLRAGLTLRSMLPSRGL
ncbi:N-acetylglucosaminyl-diphospho-decaprenol L-rhamnosyltransferase [Frigoribacterium sp. Leaf186]|nr:N-acetylglucosaminyl-diphospho-decaprenol L-rhamnosyltransferase [Frigoribacterium sp. Leaf186]